MSVSLEILNRCRALLEQAEAKQREANRRDREADDQMAADGERNIHRLCQLLLINGRRCDEGEGGEEGCRDR